MKAETIASSSKQSSANTMDFHCINRKISQPIASTTTKGAQGSALTAESLEATSGGCPRDRQSGEVAPGACG